MFVSYTFVSMFLSLALLISNPNCFVTGRSVKIPTKSFGVVRPSFAAKCQQFLEGELSRQVLASVTGAAIGKRFLATGWGAGGVDEDQPGGKGATKQPLPAKRFLATGWNAGGGDEV